MSLLSPFKLKLNKFQTANLSKKNTTSSTNIATERTIKTQKSIKITQQHQSPQSLQLLSSQQLNQHGARTQRSATSYSINEKQQIKRKLHFTTNKKFINTLNYSSPNNNRRENYKFKQKRVLNNNIANGNIIIRKNVQNSSKHRIYHSLDYKDRNRTQFVQINGLPLQQQSSFPHNKSKSLSKNSSTKSYLNHSPSPNPQSHPFPSPQIQFKCSSDKNKFSNTLIRSYGVSTYKSDKNIINNHIILINLGLIKQFYIIECIDGQQCGMWVKKNISFVLLKEYLNQMEMEKSKQDVRVTFGRHQQNQRYSILPSKNDKNSKQTQLKYKSLQSATYKTFKFINQQISQMQRQSHQNSGCFITGCLILQNIVLTVNCGLGTNILLTCMNNLIKSAQPHCTQNVEQIKRISRNGNYLYRTQFNVKYKQNLSVKGPIRLYPSGFKFTRVIGKTFTKIEERKVVIKHISDSERKNCKVKNGSQYKQIQQSIGLIGSPQIKYIQANQIQFLIITTSQLQRFMSMSLICSVVLHQVKKYSLTWTIHDIAGSCSRQILNQATLRGYNQNASLIVIFLNVLTPLNNGKPINPQNNINNSCQIKSKKNNSPLKYAGNKKSFCKYQC